MNKGYEGYIELKSKYDFPEQFKASLVDHSIIMMGESTHGTKEFYKARIELTKFLIENGKLTAITIEGDWPSAFRVNQYVKGELYNLDANEALSEFDRFPLWMWRNREILHFVEWLKSFNSTKRDQDKVGFYGLDLYSLHKSVDAVIHYLDKVDPAEAELARARYACFDKFGFDMQKYGYFVTNNLTEDCRGELIDQLISLKNKADRELKIKGSVDEDLFSAVQNAKLIEDAESYYRSIFFGSSNISWNVRDTHMSETLKALYLHQKTQNKKPKIVVWAHNSHIGDASATQFGKEGQINIGQLAREEFGKKNVFLLGLSTYGGAVSAASQWNQPVERKIIRPALENSYENLFHHMKFKNFILYPKSLEERFLERAIGVIYSPSTERFSHYFYADLKDQFDALIYYDQTEALEPLEKTALWEEG